MNCKWNESAPQKGTQRARQLCNEMAVLSVTRLLQDNADMHVSV